MESLWIDDNKIGDEGAFALARCLRKLKILIMYGCDVSEDGIEAIRLETSVCEQVG